jgi:NADH-quinone oxidoreductase subunit M
MLVAVLAAATGVVIGATYMLRFARTIVFDDSSVREPLAPDLQPRELLALAPLLLLVFWIGLQPSTWMQRSDGTVAKLARPVAVSSLGGPHAD